MEAGGKIVNPISPRVAHRRRAFAKICKPVIEWLKATAEELVGQNHEPPRETEQVSDFLREVGRPEIAYQVISSGIPVD